jgi:ATP-dependent Clp protease ATP-binding subunit ClpB
MPFRFDKLTIKAQEAVARAQELAAGAGNPQMEPVHLLAALHWRRSKSLTNGMIGS